MNIRWKRWVAGAAALVALYTAAGFWLVPKIVKSQVPKIGLAELERQASIGDVTFNPYTLRLEAADLRLAEAEGQPLFGIGKLAVELQWRSLARRAWSFSEIRIEAPSVNLVIASDGKFNLAQLLETLDRRPRESTASAGLPRLVVERFALEQGKVAMDDKRAGYSNVFTPIHFALANFSTLPAENDTHTFSAVSERGGKLRWKGEATLNPIRGSGELVLENASLPDLAVYLKSFGGATVAAGDLSATLPYRFAYADGKLEAAVAGAAVALRDLAFASEGQTPLKLARLGLEDGALDLVERKVTVGRVFAEGGQLQLVRDRQGQLDVLRMLPKFESPAAPAAATPTGAPWSAMVKVVELGPFAVDVEDQGSSIKAHVRDLIVKVEGVSNDLAQPVKFSAGFGLKEGGQLTAQGSAVPATGAVQADLRLKQIELAPLQPLLGQFVKLKIAGGNVSAQGRIVTGAPNAPTASGAKGSQLRYTGGFDVAGLVLKEEDQSVFAAWKSVSADRLVASLGPDLLEIPELRVVEPNAKLIIENDRSFNAVRLLVRPAASAPARSASAPAPAPSFPVHIRRVRLQNAKLDFTDLSLRPQFAAKIYELNGVVTGLSSSAASRSQIELDGRVDEFGLARIRGELNPFAPRDNTDIGVVFKNVDMVAASPYSMKFAGYRIAEGKISLDLQYKVRNSKLEGANQIVIDKLTLGERVDSPDAMKLPLELAIAILKDSDGRIDLGLQVSGDMDDPQFNYGALVWKAIANVLTKIITAPFRALGGLLGISGEKLEAIDFDAGSDKLLPPEREKLKQIAQMLAKRGQLKLSVPGHYSESADGAALRARAVRAEIAKRARIKLEEGEEPGPLDLRDRAVRVALRDLYTERFGAGEYDKQKLAAESAASASPASASASAPAQASAPASAVLTTASAQAPLPLWQRMGKMIQGEPQLADATAFYRSLQERLDLNQPLAADALTRLGAQRAAAIVSLLKESGVDPARATMAAPEKVTSEAGKAVPLKLALGAS